MKKEMVLTTNSAEVSSINEIIARMKETTLRPVVSISKYYSRILEKEINTHQTLLLINAQIAAALAIFPLSYSLVLRVLFISWFATAVIQCKKGGL